MTYEAFEMSKLDNGFVECGDGTYKKKEVSNEEIVDKVNDSYYSIGLTSDKPQNKKNQKLHKVYESNGKIARLKRSVTIDKIKVYSKKC